MIQAERDVVVKHTVDVPRLRRIIERTGATDGPRKRGSEHRRERYQENGCFAFESCLQIGWLRIFGHLRSAAFYQRSESL